MIAFNPVHIQNLLRKMGWDVHTLPNGEVYAVRERYRRRDFTPVYRGERALQAVLEAVQSM